MVVVAQLVRAPDCGSGGRGFESHHPPKKKGAIELLFYFNSFCKLLVKRSFGKKPGK